MNSLTSRLAGCAALAAAGGLMFLGAGCGKDKAANAPPPPQVLSEPVRPEESTPSQAPIIPAPVTDEVYTAQGKGESRPLPAFIDPVPAPRQVTVVTAPPPKPVAVVSAPPPSIGGQRTHTLAQGETLYALSRKYNVNVKNLIAANNFKDPNRLAVGTKVVIPN